MAYLLTTFRSILQITIEFFICQCPTIEWIYTDKSRMIRLAITQGLYALLIVAYSLFVFTHITI